MNNRLDDFFKDKFEGETPEFQDKYWEQAARLLDEEQPRRRRPFWWWLSGAVLLLLGTAFWWWNMEENIDPKAMENIVIEADVEKNESLQNTDSQIIMSELESDAKIISENNIGNNVANNDGEFPAENTINNTPKATTNTTKNIEQKGVESAKITNTLADNTGLEFLDKTKNTTTNTTSTTPQNTPTNSNEKRDPKSVSDIMKLLKDQPSINTTSGEDMIRGPQADLPIVRDNLVEKLPLATIHLNSVIDFPFAVNYEEEIAKDKANDENEKDKIAVHVGLFAETQVAPFKDFNENQHSGIWVGLNWSEKWSLSTNLGYHTRQATETVETVAQHRYSFGLEEDSVSLQKTQENFVESKLMVQYQPKPKHFIGVGGGVDYLISQSGNKTEKEYLYPWEREETTNEVDARNARYNSTTIEKGSISVTEQQRFYPYLEAQYNFQFMEKWGAYVNAKHFPFQKSANTFNNKLRVNLGLKYTF